MSDITLITPPDKVFNQNKSILLVYPSEETKNSVQSFLAESKEPFNIYLYNEDNDIDWLLSVHKFCEISVLDLDNLPPELNKLVSYLISFPTTYWLTKGEFMYYNKLSVNRVYDYNFLEKWIGGDLVEK
jgi:hypothetical protein